MVAIVPTTIIKTLLVTNGVFIVEISEKKIKTNIYIAYYIPKHKRKFLF